MTFPSFVQTREVSIGTASLLISADPLVIEVTITPSRGLVWDATGDRFEASTLTTKGNLGESITMTLPCTDVAGWRDSVTGALIDVSAPDSYTHTYTGTIRFLDWTNHSIGKSVTLGRFVLPAGDGSPVDLDKLLPVPGVSGGSVLVPDSWSALVADAVAAAEAIGNADNLLTGTVADARLPVTAQAATLAATFAARTNSLTFAAGDISPIAGSGPSTIQNGGVFPAWSLTKASAMTVGISAVIPSHWTTYDVVAIGAPRTGVGGGVALRHSRISAGVGDNLSSGRIYGNVVPTETGLVAGVLQSITLGSGLAVPASGKMLGLHVTRMVADAGDTTTDIWDLAVIQLVKAS